MDMSNLKIIHKRFDLIKMVEKAAQFGGDIWQSVPGSDQGRHLSQVIQIQSEYPNDGFVLRTPQVLQIDHEFPLFIRFNYRNMIFRLYPRNFRVYGDRISCLYPREVMAFEERQGGERYVLPFHDDISLSLKRIERTFREMTYEMELRIIDVSERGFGILISSYNRDYLKTHDHFWLKSINHEVLRTPIMGRVCYAASRGCFLKRGEVRVGVYLSQSLPKDILESLKMKCRFILSA
jgi:hypothetical protein